MKNTSDNQEDMTLGGCILFVIKVALISLIMWSYICFIIEFYDWLLK